MTTKRQPKKIARQLSPVGTTLTARYKGQAHTAVIVEAKDRPGERVVKYGDQLFASLSAADVLGTYAGRTEPPLT